MTEYETYVASLEARKNLTGRGREYWLARDLQPLLAYAAWENFEGAIQRARMACESAGGRPDYHFLSTTKKITAGKGAERSVGDYFLSRYACYLIAMNADSAKPEVGFAQTYFAMQTRRQELQDQLTEDEQRIEGRRRVREGNTKLTRVAYSAGVRKLGVFHNAGYKGLYGGLGKEEIKAVKQIPEKDEILDRMGRAELAANEFRITQTEQKLVREGIIGEEPAIQTHGSVGRDVREAIRKIGGTMPEKLQPEQPIKQLIAKRRRSLKAKPKQIIE